MNGISFKGGYLLRHNIFFIFLLFFICIILPDLVSAETNDDWTQYRFNTKNNPVIKNDSLEQVESVISTDDEIRSTPVVVGNRVFVGNHNSGNLYAFDLETGKLLWQNEAPNWVHSEMIYVNNQLFVGYGNRFPRENEIRGTGASGLLSLDPDTGEILWDFKTNGEVMPTPAFYKDTVYITTGDEHLYGINPKNGKERWSHNLGSTISMSSPNIKNGVLYVGGSSAYAFKAVDLDEKEMKWETPIEGVESGLDDVPPVVSDDDIVYTTGVKKTEEPLTLKQSYESDGVFDTYKQMVKLSVGKLIGKDPNTNYEQVLYAMDTQDGDIVWGKSIGRGAMVSNNKSGAPMLYDGKVFVGSPITEAFYAFDASTGEQLWEYESDINKAPPVADDDIVYFTDTKGLVYGFDTESGKLQGKKKLGGTLAPAGPLLVNDNLIVGNQDTNVYSVPTEEILQANDSVDDDSSLLSYVFFVYVLPALVLLGVIAIIIVGVKWIRRKTI